MTAIVSIIMGSSSDLPKMEGAKEILNEFQIPFELKVVSAHRTPEGMVEFAKSAKERGVKVIIAGAGGAAHLPGMVASLTELPVIGVPISLKHFDGLDSMLSILQMPKGVPVATVAVDNSQNAALLATRMLAIADQALDQKLVSFREAQKEKVRQMNESL